MQAKWDSGRCYDPYVRRVIAPSARRWTEHLAASLLQLPRILVALALGSGLAAVLSTLVGLHRAAEGGHHLENFLVGLWAAGTVVLLAELVILGLREAVLAPWPGSTPTTLGIFLRSLLSLTVLFTASRARFDSEVRIALVVAILTTLLVFGWRLPAALRGLRTCLRALRSLSIREPASWLGALRGASVRAQRRLLKGRLTMGEGNAFSLEHEGLVARCVDPQADLVVLATPGQPAAVLARVHSDGEAYRSAGLRLDGGGLPVWILDAEEGNHDPLARLRRRLTLAVLFDGGLLGSAALGAGALLVLVLSGALSRFGM